MRLEPGSVLTACRIVQGGTEVYVMEFQCGSRALTCPLHAFLPRTQITEVAVPELEHAVATVV